MPIPAPLNPDLQWLTLDDFRIGIVSQAQFGAGSLNNQVPVPAQKGAAQPFGTFGCVALPSGGLAPFASPSGSLNAPSGALLSGVNNYITGLICYGRVNFSDELIVGIDNVSATNQRTYSICSVLSTGGFSILKQFGPATSTSTSTYALTGGLTVVNPTDSTGTITGSAGVAFTTAFVNDAAPTGATAYLAIYPDPSNPGGTSIPHDYSSNLPAVGTGICFTHQSRIIILHQTEYLWTSTTEVLAGEFEHFYYTDPAGTVPGNGSGSSLTQNFLPVFEYPVGTSAFGSVSSGELFLVKRNGGGYIVSGDLNNPTVTWLGGVTPTFNFDQTAASTPVGMAYISNNNGCWAWNGGSTSQKLSTNLNDDFYQMTFPPNIGTHCKLVSWGRFLITPNNYFYDTDIGGWWKLDNQSVPFCWYGTSYDGNTLYALPASVNSTTQPIVYLFSKSKPANSYSWRSYPVLTAQTPNRQIKVREVVIRAQGRGQVSVGLQSTQPYAGEAINKPLATTPLVFPIDSVSQPILIRETCGVDAHDITAQLSVQGQAGGPAPIIYSLSLGYMEEHELNAT